MAIAANATLIPQSLSEGLAEGDPNILNSVMPVDVQIPLRRHRKVDQPVPRNLIKHVIEERQSRGELTRALPVKIEGNGNLCFQRVSSHSRVSRSHRVFLR